MTVSTPSTRTSYPVAGSASPATSGTPRPPVGPPVDGTFAEDCHVGFAKTRLTPPPVAPPLSPSFHTVSLEIDGPEACRRVPPQANTNGLEAGKSTCCCPSFTPTQAPSSPAAQQTVIPRAAAA